MNTKQHPNIKFLVAIHKPYRLINSDLFIPIWVGKALAKENIKNQTLSKKDYNWLEKHTIGDDTGDNISDLNGQYCELTAIYWAWKNYDKIGNPDFIGLLHYRTFFDLNCTNIKDYGYNQKTIESILETCDGIIPAYINSKSIENYENKNPLVKHPEYIQMKELYPQLTDAVNLFEKSTNIHYKNMFLLSREAFNEYCTMLFGIIDCLISVNPEIKNIPRGIGYYAEGISSIIFDYFILNKNMKLQNMFYLSIENTKFRYRIEYFIYKIAALFNSKFINKVEIYKNKSLGIRISGELTLQKEVTNIKQETLC